MSAAPEAQTAAGGCPSCRAEVRDPFVRRFRYPFARCAACEPGRGEDGWSEADVQNVLLAHPPCAACRVEMAETGQRFRWCHACGPAARLSRRDGRAFDPTRYTMLDEVDAVGGLLASRERVEVRDLGHHLELDGGPERPDGADWFELTPERAPPTPLFDLALRRLSLKSPPRIPWARPATAIAERSIGWVLEHPLPRLALPLDAEPGPARAVLVLEEPKRGLTWGAQLLSTSPQSGARRVGGLKPVATDPTGPRVDLLLRHLLAEMSWGELRLCFADAPCLVALQAHEAKAGPLHAARLQPRASLAELVGAAAVAIDPSTAGAELDASRPLAPLYERLGPADLEEAEGTEHYPTGIPRLEGTGLPYFEPLSTWRALLGDLCAGERTSLVAARFVVALLDALDALTARAESDVVVLQGAAIEQDDFRERLVRRLRTRGLRVEPAAEGVS